MGSLFNPMLQLWGINFVLSTKRRGIKSPPPIPPPPYPIKNLTSCVKKNHPFASQRRSARLHVAMQRRFVASDMGHQNMSDQYDFQATNLLCEGEKIFPLATKAQDKKIF